MTVSSAAARGGPATGTLLALQMLFPEITAGLALYGAARHRLRSGGDRERGDAVQWVILAAIGAAIAITVGTIIYNKLKTKSENITTDTPAPGS
jgi:hypothetical protein